MSDKSKIDRGVKRFILYAVALGVIVFIGLTVIGIIGVF